MRGSHLANSFRVLLFFQLPLALALSAQAATQGGPTPPACDAPAAARAEVLDVEPGEVIDLDTAETCALPEELRRDGSGRVYLRGDGEASAREYAARVVLPVRHHPGFEVPALAPGRYVVWYEYPNRKGPRTTLDVRPPLRAERPVARGERAGATVQVVVEVPGPADADVTLRPAESRGRARLAEESEASQTTRSQDGKAVFEVKLEACERARFTAEAPGYKAANVTVDCLPPAGQAPIPVVFVPGTGGSALYSGPEPYLARNQFWVNRCTLGKSNILEGRLNDDGTNSSPLLKATEVLAEAHLLLDDDVEKFLARQSLALAPVACDKDCNPKNKSSEGTQCWAYKYGFYSDFLGWARQNLTAPQAGGARAGFHEAPYDWRKGIEPDDEEEGRSRSAKDAGAARAEGEKVARIEDELDKRVEEALAGGHDQVILLAHSQGGLVARDYVAGRGRGKVAALIAVATPWLGTPKTARALLWGYDFDIWTPSEGAGQLTIRSREAPRKEFTQAAHVLRASVFDLDVVRSVARTWPAVFLQLPTKDFMRIYGGASAGGKGEDGSKSVIWNLPSGQVLEFFRGDRPLCAPGGNAPRKGECKDGETEVRGNPVLFDRAARWRAEYMFRRNDYGVEHLLFAGFTHESNKASYTDMQMAKPSDEVKRDGRAKLTKVYRNALRAVLGGAAKVVAGLKLWPDPYVATDRSNEWGDATAPLLSASVGALARGWGGADVSKEYPANEVARQFLGERTSVRVFKLRSGFEHGKILDEPAVRWELWKVYRRLNESRGIRINPVVNSVTVEVAWNKRSAPAFSFTLAGRGLNECSDEVSVPKEKRCTGTDATRGRPDLLPSTVKGSVLRHFKTEEVALRADKPGKCSYDEPRPYTLRMDDLRGRRLKISLRSALRDCQRKRVKGRIGLTQVRVLVNGLEVINQVFSTPRTMHEGAAEWLSDPIQF